MSFFTYTTHPLRYKYKGIIRGNQPWVRTSRGHNLEALSSLNQTLISWWAPNLQAAASYNQHQINRNYSRACKYDQCNKDINHERLQESGVKKIIKELQGQDGGRAQSSWVEGESEKPQRIIGGSNRGLCLKKPPAFNDSAALPKLGSSNGCPLHRIFLSRIRHCIVLPRI